MKQDIYYVLLKVLTLAKKQGRRGATWLLAPLFVLLMGTTPVWAADVTTTVTAVAVSPATPAPSGTVTVTFTVSAAALVGDTITYTVGGTAVATTDYTDAGAGTCTFTVAGTTCTSTINVTAGATTGNTINVTSNLITSTDATITAAATPATITLSAPTIAAGVTSASFPFTVTGTTNGTHTVSCTQNGVAATATPASLAAGAASGSIAVTLTTTIAGDVIACTLGVGGTDTITGSPASATVAGTTTTATIALTAPTIAAGVTSASFPFTVTGTTNGTHTVSCTQNGVAATASPTSLAAGAASGSIAVTLTTTVAGDVIACTLGAGGTDTITGSPASATVAGTTPPVVTGIPVIQVTVPDNTTPTAVPVELFPLGTLYPNPTACVDFGYMTPGGAPIKKTFTVGSAVATPILGVTSVNFSPFPDTAFTLANPINLTTITAPALPPILPPTTPTAGIAYFDVTFDSSKLVPAPSTSQATVVSRQMLVYNTDPATTPTVNPLIVPISATVVPTILPKIQVADSTTAVPPAGTDISSNTTIVDFTPAPVGSGTTVNRDFSVKNGGYATLYLSPTTAAFTPDTGTQTNAFTVTAFVDEGSVASAFNDTAPTSISPPAPQGCNIAASTVDFSKLKVTFTAPMVTKQTTFSGKVCFKSNDNLSVTTPIVDFCFPVKATVNPPPPAKPEIDVYYEGKQIANLTTTCIDFGTTPVGTPVKKTITIKNPSAVGLQVFDFSGNLPTGFSLLNANYASTIPSGGSTDLIFQLDALKDGSYGASQTVCQSNPLSAGCALRIPSNDEDNPSWEFNGTGIENPYTIPLCGIVGTGAGGGGTGTNITLTMTPQPTNGKVTSNTGGISCGTNAIVCAANYAQNTTVTLTATPDTGATFTSWGGSCSGTNTTTTVTMDASKTCSATFSGGTTPPTQVKLTITKPTNGTITGDGSINCGVSTSTCEAMFDKGKTVSLNALAASGMTFSSWTGNCSGSTNPFSLTMDTDKTCSAVFGASGGGGGGGGTPIDDFPGGGGTTGQISLTLAQPSGGTVTSNPAGINCGSSCTANFTQNATVQLSASPATSFTGWGGSCSGTTNPLTVTMNAAKTCTASFGSGTGTGTLAVLVHPDKGSSTWLEKTANQLFHKPTIFSGGISVSGSSFLPAANVDASKTLTWKSNATIDTAHVGQVVDVLFVVGVEPPSMSNPLLSYSGDHDTVYFAFDSSGQPFPVNVYGPNDAWPTDLALMTSKPFKAKTTLQSSLALDLLNNENVGTLLKRLPAHPGTPALGLPGLNPATLTKARIYTFVGYVLSSGTVVYNGMPLMTTLE